MNRYAMAAATIVALLVPVTMHAQDTWTVELRAGVQVPTQDVATEELGNGFGFDGTVRYAFLPHLAAYVGWDWIHFNPEASFAGADLDFEETGYAFGLRWEHPFSGDAGPAYWIRAGATYDHLELENSDGDIIGDSKHGFGWEAGAGITVGLTDSILLTPGARYRSLSRDVEVGSTTTPLDLRYLDLGLGVAFTF